VNRCELCGQDKDEAMLLVQGGGSKRQVCETCVCGLVQGQAGLVQLAAVDEAMAIIALGILQAAARVETKAL
jgi:ribosome-binding protein aMBF1 (putative translation factor)